MNQERIKSLKKLLLVKHVRLNVPKYVTVAERMLEAKQ